MMFTDLFTSLRPKGSEVQLFNKKVLPTPNALSACLFLLALTLLNNFVGGKVLATIVIFCCLT